VVVVMLRCGGWAGGWVVGCGVVLAGGCGRRERW
jgi:hypothetical protein